MEHKPYVLIWNTTWDFDNQEGIEYFKTIDEMDERVEDLNDDFNGNINIELSGYLAMKYEYVPVEKVIKLKRKE